MLYLGTATYESQSGWDLQAEGFKTAGCDVHHLKLSDTKTTPPRETIKTLINNADIIAVSGGNTLFAMTRWRRLGLDKLLRQAMDNSAVLCGGSAGAICWFDGGHSDSRDPTTVKSPSPSLSAEDKKSWRYIRVTGLGLLPGLCCPHHDTTQSNGVPRATDFDAMLLRHSRETGVCIDDQAAISVDGNSWRVLSTDGTSGVAIKVSRARYGDCRVVMAASTTYICGCAKISRLTTIG